MAHKCKSNNCSNDVFSHDFCRLHQWMRSDDAYQRQKQFKKKNKPPVKLPQESKKRKEERKYYSQICREIEQETRDANEDRIFCFFSGLEIIGKASFHHLKGRTGKDYIDKEWLVPCINKYHLEYHFKPVEWLLKQSWYEGFLNRLKEKSEELYNKEINKQTKVNKLNPTFDFDENNDD